MINNYKLMYMGGEYMGKYILMAVCISFLFSSGLCFAALPSAAIDSEPVISTQPQVAQNTQELQEPQEPVKDEAEKTTTTNGKDDKVFKKIDQASEADQKRFVLIAKDSRFFYYLDRRSARWIFEPNSNRKIMDVWIQLIDANKVNAPAEKYSNVSPDQSYLLDHYYIRPELRQIQFLCELDVVGQPSNNVTQNLYSVKNWEDIIPGSVEETIFNAVMATKENLVGIDTKSSGMDVQARDFLDRVFNVSL